MKDHLQAIMIVVTAALLAAPALAERQKKEWGGAGGCGACQHGSGGGGQDVPRGGPPSHGEGGPGGRRGGPPAPGRFIEKMLEKDVAEKLGLEAEQVEALQKGLKRIQKQEEKLREKLQAAGKKQAELLSAEGDVDEEAVMNAIEETGRIRTQMAKLRIRPILLLKQTLTAEQLQASKRMMHNRMEQGRKQWADQSDGEEEARRGRGRHEERRGPRRNRDDAEEPDADKE